MFNQNHFSWKCQHIHIQYTDTLQMYHIDSLFQQKRSYVPNARVFHHSQNHSHQTAINIQINRSGNDVNNYVKIRRLYVSENNWNKSHPAHTIPISFIVAVQFFFNTHFNSSEKKEKLRKTSYEIFPEKMRLNSIYFEAKHNRKNQWNEKFSFFLSLKQHDSLYFRDGVVMFTSSFLRLISICFCTPLIFII